MASEPPPRPEAVESEYAAETDSRDRGPFIKACVLVLCFFSLDDQPCAARFSARLGWAATGPGASAA